MAQDETNDVIAGDGYALGTIDAIGEGYGFRKIRHALGVTAFGVNAIVMPAGYESGRHFHDQQEELYFVHQGRVEFQFGDGTSHVLGPGGLARVDPATIRKVKNVSDEDAVYVVTGGKDGYVGRDGQAPDGDPRSMKSGPPGAA
jgi:quercetin dioxygenase-like cupin family protein